MATKASTTKKTVAPATKGDSGLRALRMAKGYGRESLATALGTTMAEVYRLEVADTLPADVRKAIEALPVHGNPLTERTTPLHVERKVLTPEEKAARTAALYANGYRAVREDAGVTREALAQHMGITTTALWHLEQGEKGSPEVATLLEAVAAASGQDAPAPTAKASKSKGKAKVEDLI